MVAIAATLFVAGPAAAFGDCRTPGYLQRFDARLPESLPVDCTQILLVDIEAGSLRVPMRLIRYQAAPALNDETAMRYVRLLAAKTGAAMHLLGDLDLARVSILLTDMPSTLVSADATHPAYAAATGWLADDECTIAFYKQDTATSEEYFLITLAHEIFHCVQGKTWHRKTSLYPVGAWWVEGSAVYFSHLVVPDTNQLDFLSAAFDATSPRKALVDMDYDAEVFFLWLHQTAGPHTGVKRLIDALPDSGGRDAQISALQGALPLDRFGEFAENYLDSEIRQPGGRLVPTSVRVPTTSRISGPRTKSSEVEPYVIGREILVFEEGKSYDLETSLSDGGRVRFQEGGGGAWADPPSRISACDEDQHYLVAVVATGGPATATFNVTDAEEVDRRACCLIGSWKPTAESAAGFAAASNAVAGQMGASTTCNYAGGDWTLTFGAGTGAFEFNGFVNRCVARMGAGEMVSTITSSGAHDFQYTIVDRGVGNWTTTSMGINRHLNMSIGGRTAVDRTTPDSGAPGRGGGFVFTCSDTDLTIKGLYPITSYETTHKRIGPTP